MNPALTALLYCRAMLKRGKGVNSIYIHICVFVYIYIYVYLSVCIYIYILTRRRQPFCTIRRCSSVGRMPAANGSHSSTRSASV